MIRQFHELFQPSLSRLVLFPFPIIVSCSKGKSMTSQFHEFFQPYFWRVFAIWNYCATQHSSLELTRPLCAFSTLNS